MELRRYRPEDTAALCDIFYETIHTVNKADYTPEELEAWAPSNSNTEASYKKDRERWLKIKPFVVTDDGAPVGFAELEGNGHINCFFVNYRFLGKGIGTMLMDACIKEAKRIGYDTITAEVSITAKSFFERQGFDCMNPVLCDIGELKVKYYKMMRKV